MTKFQSFLLAFFTTVIFQILQYLTRVYSWALLSENMLIILFAILSTIFWVYLLKRKVWLTKFKAVLNMLFVTFISSIISYFIIYFISGGSLLNIQYDNLGQMVSVFILFIYCGFVIFSYLVAFAYMKIIVNEN